MSKKVTNELNDLKTKIQNFHQALDSLTFSSSSQKPAKKTKESFHQFSPPKSTKRRDKDTESTATFISRDSHRIAGSMRTSELLSDREIEYYKKLNKHHHHTSGYSQTTKTPQNNYRTPIITNAYPQRTSTLYNFSHSKQSPISQSSSHLQNRYLYSMQNEPSVSSRTQRNNFSPVSTRFIPSPQIASSTASKYKRTQLLFSSDSTEEDSDLPSPVLPDSDFDSHSDSFEEEISDDEYLNLKKTPTLEQLTGDSEIYQIRAKTKRIIDDKYDSYSDFSSTTNRSSQRLKPIPEKTKRSQIIPQPIVFDEEEEEEDFNIINNFSQTSNSRHRKKSIQISQPLSFSCQSSKFSSKNEEESYYISEEEYNEQSYLDKSEYISYTSNQSPVELEHIPNSPEHDYNTSTPIEQDLAQETDAQNQLSPNCEESKPTNEDSSEKDSDVHERDISNQEPQPPMDNSQKTEKPKRIDSEYISKLFRDLPVIVSDSDDDDDYLIFTPPVPDQVILGDPLEKKPFVPVLEDESTDDKIPEKWNTLGVTPPEFFKNDEEEEEEEFDQDTNLVTQDTPPLTSGVSESDGWGVPMGSSQSTEHSQVNNMTDSEPISYVTKQEPFVSVTDTDLTKIDELASLPNSDTHKKSSKIAPPLPLPELQTSLYDEGASSSYLLDGDDL